MGSQISGTVPKAHANTFDSQGRVVDYPVTSLHTPVGAFQELHNAADQGGANHPRWPNSNQDLRGAEAAGPSQITTSF